jgi:hypothetical protein
VHGRPPVTYKSSHSARVIYPFERHGKVSQNESVIVFIGFENTDNVFKNRFDEESQKTIKKPRGVSYTRLLSSKDFYRYESELWVFSAETS